MPFQHADSQTLAAVPVPGKTWYRTEEAAKILGVSVRQITRWAREGKIHGHQPAGNRGMWFIHRCAVEDVTVTPVATS